MRRRSPTICTSVCRLPMCQASRASACASAAAISTKGSALPAMRTKVPSSMTSASPSRSCAGGGHLVGFRSDLDIRRRVVVDHALLRDRARLLDRDQLLLDAEPVGELLT